MNTFLDSLHFLRPQALWLLLLVPLLLLYRWHRCRRQDIWRSSVDPHLLPQLLVTHRRHRSWTGIALGLGGIVAILALAGPSWRQQAQPLLRSQAPLVLVLDLSDRITATDLQPSRLLQARAKLATLLRERQGGEIALVVYAGEAFTVAPLTADAANVGLFLDALAPEVMPVAGQRPDLGVQWAASLLQQAHARQGDIVLLSDRGDGRANRAAAQAAASGYRVSVLGVGTATGAAYRDRAGRIERAALDESSLRALAAAGQGRYARLSVDDTDLRSLAVLQPQAQESSDDASRLGRSWHDDGYWLLPPLLLLGLLAFRRRAGVSAVLALACLLPLSMPAQAAEGGWWKRADQARHQRLSAGVEAYRSGDYATAQQRFEGIDSDEGWYNLGNALARQGKYDEAIAAYDRALKHQPEMADALANRAAVAAARKRQQQQPGQQGQQSKQNQQNQQNPSGEGADGKQEPGSSGAPSADKGRPPPSPGGEAKAGDSRTKQSANAPPSSAANPPKPAAEDAQSQQQADQAQRERMRQAMQQAGTGKPDGRPAVLPSAEQREQQQAVEAWMQRVPDEPGNLLKTKFQLEYERRMREGR